MSSRADLSAPYAIDDTSQIISPALVVFRELVERNIQTMLDVAGSAARLRPHCKTHKMSAVTELELQAGITKHKCATIAEAEMLAEAGVKDIFIAYNLVGPNIGRALQFKRRWPDVELLVCGDHPMPLEALGAAMAAEGLEVQVVLDVDVGQERTGVQPGGATLELYRLIASTPGLQPGGLHTYDGHNHQTDLAERTAAVDQVWENAVQCRDTIESAGFDVPRIIAGGTGSFPIFAGKTDPALELSPGTVVFHDAGYSEAFPDLAFTPAAVLLTRVVSLPGEGKVTFDLGTKACASDPPAGDRLRFPSIPDARAVLQNEEHLVIETEQAAQFVPGDERIAIPIHICPTSALHKEAFVVSEGKLQERWPVTSRDRWLTI